MSDIVLEVLAGDGAKAKQVQLPQAVFGVPVNVALIHQVVVAQLAAARQGTHATKTRAQVSGGGSKPWRQKGTGRARQGSRRAPQWTGGGTVFGPQPRSYAQRTNKKMIAAALRSALSDRVSDGRLFVVNSVVSGDTPSTRQALEALSVIGDYTSALVVLHRDEDLAWLSLRNVPHVHALAVDQLNVYDVVANQMVVFTSPALGEFLARYGIDLADEADQAEAATPEADAEAAASDQAEAASDQADDQTEESK
jgi:large subunit ribosomal protein L4